MSSGGSCVGTDDIPKTLLCLVALCLPATQWSASYLRGLGTVLQLPTHSVDGAITLTYNNNNKNGDDNPSSSEESTTTLLERAERLADPLQCTLSQEDAIAGFVTILVLTLRGQELWEQQCCAAATAAGKQEQRRQHSAAALQFNARTSVVLRRLAYLLRIRLSSVAALEELALRQLQQDILAKNSALASSNTPQDTTTTSKTKRTSWRQHATIGAATVAVGSLLLVSGGLAAPALAAGLTGLGLGAASTIVTTSAAVTLLGTAGAGWTALKVSRRLQGLKYFAVRAINTETAYNNIENRDNKVNCPPQLKGMTVYICVSGLLREPGPEPLPQNKSTINTGFLNLQQKQQPTAAWTSMDFFAPWGAMPPQMHERDALDRFYAQVAPTKRVIVPALLEHYAGRNQQHQLFDKLEDIYGVSVQNMPQPDTCRPSAYCTGNEATIYQQLLQAGTEQVALILQQQQQVANQQSQCASSANNDAAPPTTWFTGMKQYITETTIQFMMTNENEIRQTIEKPKLEAQQHDKNDQIIQEPTSTVILEGANLGSNLTDDDNDDTTFSLSITEQNADLLRAEIELLDMEEIVPTSSLTVGNVSKIRIKETTTTASLETVYWWRESVARYGDQYTLLWDPDKLLEIGRCVDNLIKEGVDKGIQKALQFTALSAVLTAVALPMAIISLVQGLDENWTMTSEAADEAGLLLADALLAEEQGNRPFVLVGFSMGGRVVAKCLTELAAVANGTSEKSEQKKHKRVPKDEKQLLDYYADDNFQFLTRSIENDTALSEKEKKRRTRAATVVRDAVIIGAPVDTAAHKWVARRSVVLGRLINVYNPTDWILSLLYRYKRWSVVPLAGLKEVTLPSSNQMLRDDGTQSVSTSGAVDTVENFDCSDLVDSHGDYPAKMKQILERVGLGDYCEQYHSRYFA